MAIDGIILNKIKNDLHKRLPIRINRIQEVGNNELVFNVHANKERLNLLISCHSIYNRIHFTAKEYNSFNEPGGFVMLLRKKIQGGIITEIEQFDYDRYLKMTVLATNDLYDKEEYYLYVELMGKYANLILVSKDNKIVDALKKIPPFENNQRTIWPGAKYILPKKQNKLDPFINFKINQEESLVSQFMGFSPLLQKEVYQLLKEYSFKDIMDIIDKSNNLYIANQNGNLEYHIIPLKHTNLKFKSYNLHYGFDIVYYELEKKERIKHISDDIFKIIKRQIKHLNDKLIKLNDSLRQAFNCESLKINGELLFTYSNLNKKGLREINITDYEDNVLNIKLDERLNIKDNANKYFKEYHKKRKSIAYLEEQIKITQDELAYFKSINEELIIADIDDILEIKDEMIKLGYLRKAKITKRKKANKWHLYQFKYQDALITFGKNHLQNNKLTFEYARKDHYWFHAKDYHGAHVNVNTNNLNEDLIRFCANIAAYYSKGRLSSSVGVDYCLIKDVHKIKGSKEGKVTIRNHKTIFIDPELVDETDLIII